MKIYTIEEKAKDAICNLRYENLRIRNSVLSNLNNLVLSDPLFFVSPGGVNKHHDYQHGLVIHVGEVMRNVRMMTNFSPSDELSTAVIWHDYMKIREYAVDTEGKVVKLPYRNLIRHVAGSAMEFHSHAIACLPIETIERIEHLLLSHHGRQEWGSPVEPATAEAFILHAADMMSACGVNL